MSDVAEALPPYPWTPGEWNWVSSSEPSHNGAFHLYLVDARGRKIAAMWGGAEEKVANARLTAASPSLAEALDTAPILSKYHGPRGFDVERFIADYEAWRVKSRACLALARGDR